MRTIAKVAVVSAAGAAVMGLMSAAGAQTTSAPSLVFPLGCELGRTCEVQNYMDHDPGPEARDYRCGTRTYEAHGGTDLRVPDLAVQRRGVSVLAAASGRVARLRDGVADVSVRAAGQAAAVQGSECGNGVVIDHGAGWETQYCHLARGSIRVQVNQKVDAGQPIAQVGLSGNTEYPHLHFTVRRGATAVDPFAPQLRPGACGAGAGESLWSPSAAEDLNYQLGAVLNGGFAGAPVGMGDVEEAQIPAPRAESEALIAYGRVIALSAGDIVQVTMIDPGGATIVDAQSKPMNGPKAQYLQYAGKRRPANGFAPGTYKAHVSLLREGKVIARKTYSVRL